MERPSRPAASPARGCGKASSSLSSARSSRCAQLARIAFEPRSSGACSCRPPSSFASLTDASSSSFWLLSSSHGCVGSPRLGSDRLRSSDGKRVLLAVACFLLGFFLSDRGLQSSPEAPNTLDVSLSAAASSWSWIGAVAQKPDDPTAAQTHDHAGNGVQRIGGPGHPLFAAKPGATEAAASAASSPSAPASPPLPPSGAAPGDDAQKASEASAEDASAKPEVDERQTPSAEARRGRLKDRPFSPEDFERLKQEAADEREASEAQKREGAAAPEAAPADGGDAPSKPSAAAAEEEPNGAPGVREASSREAEKANDAAASTDEDAELAAPTVPAAAENERNAEGAETRKEAPEAARDSPANKVEGDTKTEAERAAQEAEEAFGDSGKSAAAVAEGEANATEESGEQTEPPAPTINAEAAVRTPEQAEVAPEAFSAAAPGFAPAEASVNLETKEEREPSKPPPPAAAAAEDGGLREPHSGKAKKDGLAKKRNAAQRSPRRFGRQQQYAESTAPWQDKPATADAAEIAPAAGVPAPDATYAAQAETAQDAAYAAAEPATEYGGDAPPGGSVGRGEAASDSAENYYGGYAAASYVSGEAVPPAASYADLPEQEPVAAPVAPHAYASDAAKEASYPSWGEADPTAEPTYAADDFYSPPLPAASEGSAGTAPPSAAYASSPSAAYASSGEGEVGGERFASCREPQVLESTLEQHCDAWCTTEALKHWEGSRPVWASLHLSPVPSFLAELRTGLFVFFIRHRDTFQRLAATLEKEGRELGAFLAAQNRHFRDAYPNLWQALAWLLGLLLLSRLLTGEFLPRPTALLLCLGGRDGFCERRRRRKEEQRQREEVARAVVESLVQNPQIKWLLTQTKKTSFVCEKLKGSLVETQRGEKPLAGGKPFAGDDEDGARMHALLAAMQREQEQQRRLLQALQEEQKAENLRRQSQLELILSESKKQFDAATMQQAEYSLFFLQALGRVLCAVDPTFSPEEKEELEACVARSAAAMHQFFSGEEARPEDAEPLSVRGLEGCSALPAPTSLPADESLNQFLKAGMTPRGLLALAGHAGPTPFAAARAPGLQREERDGVTSMPQSAQSNHEEERKASGVSENAETSRHSSSSTGHVKQEGPRGVVPPNLFGGSPPSAPSPFSAAGVPAEVAPLPSQTPSFPSLSRPGSAESPQGLPSGLCASHGRAPAAAPQGLKDPFSSQPPCDDIEGGGSAGLPTRRVSSSSVVSAGGASTPTAASSPLPGGFASNGPATKGHAFPPAPAPSPAPNAPENAGPSPTFPPAPAPFAGPDGPSAPRGRSFSGDGGARDETLPQAGGERRAAEDERMNAMKSSLPNGTGPLGPLPPLGVAKPPLDGVPPPPMGVGARPQGRIVRERREPPKVQAATNPFGVPPPAAGTSHHASGMDI
ncbi:hypothetical protein BESB_080160 [Besnoitia besnoiti]|uniref:Uncharacterized protein n=1 Tax=Besnoitia besnoiti TaxID=94643 RepID=A0A2A9MEI8_BESBE|nr:hypothetical protein BESB_080160 [Besnoitia besnoiti]PFH33800.1 hypothetical protein BESB_080160 [Besnoitia besnoiti]